MGDGHHAAGQGDLVVREIGDVPRRLAGLEGGDHIGVVHQSAPGHVDDAHAVLHFGNGRGVDGILGGLHIGQVEGNVIRAGVQRVQLLHHLDVPVQPKGGVHRQIRVIAVHIHTQGEADVSHQRADGPQPHHAQGFAVELRPHKGGFALLHRGGHVHVPGLGLLLHPGRAADHIPGGQQHGAQHQLLHRVGIGPGGIEHHDARLGAALHGNVVHPGSRPGNGPQLLGKNIVMELGGTHQDGVLILHPVAGQIALSGQALQTDRGNFIHGFNIIHGENLDLY